MRSGDARHMGLSIPQMDADQTPLTSVLERAYAQKSPNLFATKFEPGLNLPE
jgi:hypothetical protein